jgi:hypothetical protein
MRVGPWIFASGLALSLLEVPLASSTPSSSVWDLGTLESGKTYPTSVSISNSSCPGLQTLELSRHQLDWVEIVGPTTIKDVPAGQARKVKVIVDLRAKEAGTYRGTLKVRCLTCPRSCAQDVGAFQVVVQVIKPSTTLPLGEATSHFDPHASGPQQEANSNSITRSQSMKANEERSRMADAVCSALAENESPEDINEGVLFDRQVQLAPHWFCLYRHTIWRARLSMRDHSPRGVAIQR